MVWYFRGMLLRGLGSFIGCLFFCAFSLYFIVLCGGLADFFIYHGIGLGKQDQTETRNIKNDLREGVVVLGAYFVLILFL